MELRRQGSVFSAIARRSAVRWQALRWGGLTAGGPAVFLVLHAVYAPDKIAWIGWAVIALAVLLTAGLIFLDRRPGVGRWLTGGSLLLATCAVVYRLEDAPGTVLICLVVLTGALLWLWAEAPQRGLEGRPVDYTSVALRASAGGALLVWFIADPMGLASGVWSRAGAGAVSLLPVGLALATRRGGWRLPPMAVVCTALVGLALALGVWFGRPQALLRGPAVVAFILFALARPLAEVTTDTGTDLWSRLFHNPGHFLVATFLGVCAVGGLLLSLPPCSTAAAGVHLLDAMFTSVSATCVTGLVVVDTAVDYSKIGQAVILLLIQVGGLGIMTFYAAAALLLRQRMSIRAEGAAAELLGSKGRSGLLSALHGILVVTFVTEAIGALLLAWAFGQMGDAPLQALWRGLFTSVSAYCNAGFALQTASLIPYQTHPFVLHVVALLIIIGGLGPAVVLALPDLMARRRVSLHARLALSSTVFLLVVPACLIAAIEWSNTLASMTVWNRLSNAWFQSATTRTAGFNSIDLTAAHPATLVLMEILMFIGGSPGSTAGGIKTTTAVLLFLAVVATLRARTDATAFGWRIPHGTIYKAVTTFLLGLIGVFGATVALLLTQPLSFQVALFEVVSALGTVGLSIGATGVLDGVGKIVIMLCMFTGRVGMLTLLLSLSERRATLWTLPEQDVIVG